jgi:hypothetical protein
MDLNKENKNSVFDQPITIDEKEDIETLYRKTSFETSDHLVRNEPLMHKEIYDSLSGLNLSRKTTDENTWNNTMPTIDEEKRE